MAKRDSKIFGIAILFKYIQKNIDIYSDRPDSSTIMILLFLNMKLVANPEIKPTTPKKVMPTNLCCRDCRAFEPPGN